MDVTKLIGAFRDLTNAHSSSSMRQWQVGSVFGNKPADSPSSGHPGTLCAMSLTVRSHGESDGESHGVSSWVWRWISRCLMVSLTVNLTVSHGESDSESYGVSRWVWRRISRWVVRWTLRWIWQWVSRWVSLNCPSLCFASFNNQ